MPFTFVALIKQSDLLTDLSTAPNLQRNKNRCSTHLFWCRFVSCCSIDIDIRFWITLLFDCCVRYLTKSPYLEAVLVHPVKQEGVVDRLRDDVLIRHDGVHALGFEGAIGKRNGTVLLLSAVSIFAGSTPASRRVDISATTPSITWFVATDAMN